MRKLRFIGLALFAWASLLGVVPASEARDSRQQARAHQGPAVAGVAAARGRQATARGTGAGRSRSRAVLRPRSQAQGLASSRARAATSPRRAQASRGASRPHPARAAHRPVQRGRASFYASQLHGQRMANGQRFNQHSSSAASRTLPLGSRARVRNLDNGRPAEVVIDDRGPHSRSRVMDVSPAVASRLGMQQAGTARVEIVPLVSSAQAARRRPD